MLMLTLVCWAATTVQAQVPPGSSLVQISNQLDEPLVFRAVTQRQSIRFTSSPPARIAPGQSASFSLARAAGGGHQSMALRYDIGSSEGAASVSIEFRRAPGGVGQCQARHPRTIEQSIRHCGGGAGNARWTYEFRIAD